MAFLWLIDGGDPNYLLAGMDPASIHVPIFFILGKQHKKVENPKTGGWKMTLVFQNHPNNYLVNRCLEPLNVFSGAVWGSKHLLTRYLED